MEYAQYNHTESESMFPPADPAHQIPSTFPLDHSHPFQAIDGGAMGSSCGPYDERQGYHGYGMTAAEEGGDATRGPRLTQEQLAHLEGEFARNSKPNTEYKKGLADRMGVELAKLNNWFQNRRAKAKHEGHAQQRSDRSFREAVPPFGSTLLDYNRISGSQNSGYYSSPEQAPVMSDDLGALVEFECLNDAPLQYYHEHDTLSSSQSFDTSTTLQHDLSNTMNTDSYDPWSSNNLYGDAKAPMSSVQVHEIDSLGMVSASPSGHSSCVDFGLGNAQWTHPPIYQNTAGGQLVGNPSSQSFGTSPSEEGEHAKFITPPQETSPLPRPNQGPFQHDRQASNSSELAENLDTVHIQTSQAGLGLNANSAYVSGPNANSTTGLLTPEVSPDTIAPKLPFPSTHDLASRRKRPRPAALQPDSNRSASYAGPMTTSPHLRISPPGSGKMSPVRRIKSQGNNSNVIAGRIKKPGATTAQISPRNLESCFKVAEPQSSMDLDAHRRQSSGANGNSLTALSPSTMLNRRQGTWPESPSHTALPSSSWDKSLNNNNMPYATSPPDSHWHPYQSGQSNINMAIHPPQPEYSQQFPHHYPPQSAPSHVTTFEVASMTPENFGVNWLNPPIQSEPYRDDTRLQGPFRPTHLQHHGHSGPFNYYQAPGPSFQTYAPHMGSLLSFPPCLNRPPTPPHKALEIKVETGPPPPKEMVQTSQDRKEYTFENSFAGDPHFLTGSKK